MNTDEARTSLSFLDPGDSDSGYWHRFRHRVLVLAGPELARRRSTRPVTVGDVMLGWRNALVPTALLAATLAGLLLIQQRTLRSHASAAYEEMLVSGLEEPIPALLVSTLTEDGAPLSPDGNF